MAKPDSWEVVGIVRRVAFYDDSESGEPLGSLKDITTGAHAINVNLYYEAGRYAGVGFVDVNSMQRLAVVHASTSKWVGSATRADLSDAELKELFEKEIVPDLQARLDGLTIANIKSKPK